MWKSVFRISFSEDRFIKQRNATRAVNTFSICLALYAVKKVKSSTRYMLHVAPKEASEGSRCLTESPTRSSSSHSRHELEVCGFCGLLRAIENHLKDTAQQGEVCVLRLNREVYGN